MKVIKHLVFRFYVAITLVLLVVTIIGVMVARGSVDWPLIVPLISLVVSFFYFVQKQSLEELRLFRELFAEFNQRYDRLNEDLNRIRLGDQDKELTADEVDTLYDYFNLCGEEYLYFKRGYIYPEVWRAWLNGMKIFYENERVKELWDEELETGSYYGLRIE